MSLLLAIQHSFAADSLGTTDAAVCTRTLPRIGADTLATTDVATKKGTYARTATDVLAASYSATVLADSPIAYLRHDASSGTSETDASGNGHAGTYTATGVTLGQPSALSNDPDASVLYDGATGDMIVDTLGNFGSLAGSCSGEFWLKTTDTGQGYVLGVSDTNTTMGFVVRLNTGIAGTLVNGRLLIQIRGSNNVAITVSATGPFNDGFWHHVMFTHDQTLGASSVVVYRDQVVCAQSVSGNSSTATYANFVHSMMLAGFNFNGFPGSRSNITLDEVAFYGSILSSARASAHYNAGAADLATRILIAPRTPADSLATTDAATRATQSFTRTGSDTLSTTDASTRVVVQTRTGTDSLGTTDVATQVRLLPRSGSDSLGTTDAVTRAAQSFTRTSADSLSTTDAATRITLQPRTGSDSLGTIDAASRSALLRSRTGSDTLGTSDAATRLLVFARSGSDSLNTTDVATRSRLAPRTTADSLTTTDAAIRSALVFVRSGSDTLGTTDAATRLATFTRTGADSLSTTDAATRLLVTHRTGSDSLSTTDAATRLAILPRTGSDSLSTTDAATRLLTFARSSSDSLGTTDVGTRILIASRTTADTLATSYRATILANSPIAYYRLDAASGTSESDASGNSHTGTYSATGVTLNQQSALSNDPDAATLFDGATGDLILDTLGNFGSAVGACTVEFWLNTTDIGQGYVLGVSDSNTTMAYVIRLNTGTALNLVNGRLLIQIRGSNNVTITVSATGPFNDGKWHHVAFTHDKTLGASSVVVYRDGVICAQSVSGNSSTATFANFAHSMMLAGFNFNGTPGSRSNVTLDEVAFYGSIFSSSQVITDYNVGAADLATRVVINSRTGSDSLGTTDSSTRLNVLPRTSTDALGTTDAVTRVILDPRSGTDSLGTSDTATRSLTLPRTGADTLGTTDLASRQEIVSRAGADSLGTSDGVTRQLTPVRTASDLLNTGDIAIASSQNFHSALGVDSLITTDDATRAGLAFIRTGVDTLGTSDAVTDVPKAVRTTSDSLGTTDISTRSARISIRSGSDTLNTTEVATRITLFIHSAVDSLSTTDTATRGQVVVRITGDSLFTTDVATRILRILHSTSDTLGSNDAAIRQLSLSRTGSDHLATTDSASRTTQHFNRITLDALGTSDTASSVLTRGRQAADLIGTIDVAMRGPLAFTHSAADSLGTFDQAGIRLRPRFSNTINLFNVSLYESVVISDSSLDLGADSTHAITDAFLTDLDGTPQVLLVIDDQVPAQAIVFPVSDDPKLITIGNDQWTATLVESPLSLTESDDGLVLLNAV